jgi:peptidoglycan/xylan/chitin deacetylase (PgdA/CDA1 family)
MVRWLALLALLLSFGTAPAVAAGKASAQKRIALSFDDVPRQRGAFFTPDERTERLIRGLRQARVRQALFFVTPGNLAKPDGAGGERQIEAYVRAGHVLGNHSFAHRPLTGITAAEYIADIDQAQRWLQGRRGVRPWFRFPFLNEGRSDKAKRDAVRAALAERGLRNGYVTADGADWNMEALTTAAVKGGKQVDMAALRDLYVETMVGAADYNEALGRRLLGRSPVQMLLLHETDLAALFIPDLVAALRKAGWRMVSADEAYRDPVGRLQPDVPSAQGTLTEALAWERVCRRRVGLIGSTPRSPLRCSSGGF